MYMVQFTDVRLLSGSWQAGICQGWNYLLSLGLAQVELWGINCGAGYEV